MRVRYDAEGDALYIPLRERGGRVARSVCVDVRRIVDLDANGEPVGIEVLAASRGVSVKDLIERFGLESLRDELLPIEKHWFQPMQYAPPITGLSKAE